MAGTGRQTRTLFNAGQAQPTRRDVAAGLAAAITLPSIQTWAAEPPITFGLTPVLLDSDLPLLIKLEAYLTKRTGRPVNLIKRRTYQEISALLLSGQLDAAWICGFPFVQYQDQLSLVAVPLFSGKPLYQSYVIGPSGSPAKSVDDLKGKSHAFSDPDSNSGFLVTRHLLALQGESPSSFFSTSFFTYGHRNVIRAVGSGLAESGSVDGYIWEVLLHREPQLVQKTKVIRKSEPLGFPPVAALTAHVNSMRVKAIRSALLNISDDELGREILSMLQLDGFVAGNPGMFTEIAAKYEFVRRLG